MMTTEERARIHELCRRIQEEHDPSRYLELIEELNRLLDKPQARHEPND